MEYFNGVLIDTENLPVMKLRIPFNTELCAIYGRSFTYSSLKDRLPHIITKVIDYASREGSAIKSSTGASDADLKNFIEAVVKLKNDLATNKQYEHFTVDTEEGKNWNKWIDALTHKKYFTNIWVFTECYVYRKLYEACELNNKLSSFDYFEEHKRNLLNDNMEPLCYVANKVTEMFPKTSDKAARKASFVTLLKLCAWANKCDRNFSCGEKVTLADGVNEGPAKPKPLPPRPPAPPPKKKGKPPPGPLVISPEPLQMILDLKERFVIDDTNKISDQVCNKAEAVANKIAAITTFKYKCSCHRLAKAFGKPLCEQESPAPAEGEAKPAEELPKIPCPAKMVTPITISFDIVCDNAGYELFTDMCLGAFLLDQEIVKRVRFHVKRMPWFMSDATPKDVNILLDTCERTTFSFTPPPPPPGPEGSEPPPAAEPVTSAKLNALATKFKSYIAEGKFLILSEDFWTTPLPYFEMKAKDYPMYRKLQFAVAVMFKGDLNYRKLLADRKPNPYSTLESNLQGFIPAPIIAARTVKSELICGMPKGKYEVYTQQNPNWMTSSDYGMVQYCPKAEPLKPADRPCWDYCETCFGVVCPDHSHDL